MTDLRGSTAAILADRLAVEGEVARFQALARYGYLAAFLLHVCFLAAFLIIAETSLAAVNVVSLATYVVVIVLHRRGQVALPFFIAWIEVTAHQILATLVFGLDSGFQYYLLVISIGGALIPSWTLWRRSVMALMPLLILLALVLYAQVNAPLRPPPPTWELTFQLANLFGLAVVLIALVLGYATAASAAEAALEDAYVASESLLDNILPKAISARLKQGEQTVADRFDVATILFVDIVGSTRIAGQMPPDQLVRLLDQLIRAFDALAAECGVEKIKTVGDAWLGVAGVPEPCPDHAERVARLALAMMREPERIRETTGVALQLRIGIATGSVVAGVIGRDKFAYDLWGDAVNLAARMESEGQPGRIQVAQETWRLLRTRYDFEPRDLESVKGRGKLRAYVLTDRPGEAR